jgi:phosphoribosylglycinamide formyltransferase-1
MDRPKSNLMEHLRAKVAVGVSGSGRSLTNFLKRQAEFTSYEIGAVIASRPDCYAVTIAQQHGIPIFIDQFSMSQEHAVRDRLYPWLQHLGISWIALAGFLRPFPTNKNWEGRTINIHPALLPRFGGKGMYGDHVHKAVIAKRERESGATIHFVNEHYDEGAIIAQITVPVGAKDTYDTLADRVFAAECRLYPEVLDRLVRGELPLPQGKVWRIQDAAP